MNTSTNPTHPAPNVLIRLPAVMAQTGMKRPTIYEHMRRGLFPRPVKLGPKLAAWPAAEVDQINAARIAGQNDDQIRALVKSLTAARTQAA